MIDDFSDVFLTALTASSKPAPRPVADGASSDELMKTTWRCPWFINNSVARRPPCTSSGSTAGRSSPSAKQFTNTVGNSCSDLGGWTAWWYQDEYKIPAA